MDDAKVGIEYAYKKRIAEEKRRRKAAERKLDEVKYENIALRNEVEKQVSSRIEDRKKMKKKMLKVMAAAAVACTAAHIIRAAIRK